MMPPRRSRYVPGFEALEQLRLLSALAGTWIGQDGHDYVGPSSQLGADGIQDIRISLTGLPAGRSVVSARILGQGGGAFQIGHITGDWAADLIPSGSTTADLYITPYQVETGREWDITLNYDDGTSASTTVAGGKADPGLHLVLSTLQVASLGQDGHDLTGPGPGVGPDGYQDVHLVIAGLDPARDVSAVTIDGLVGKSYQYGLNRQADANAELVRQSANTSQADLYFSPDRNLNGQTLTVQVQYANGQFDSGIVTLGSTSATLADTPPAPPPAQVAGVTGAWAGQDGLDLVSMGDVHLTLAGIPAARTVTAAMLTDLAGGTWAYRSNSSVSLWTNYPPWPIAFQQSGTRADLTFAPIRDETGDPLTLRLVFDDGTMALVTIAGGSVDLSRVASAPAATSITAHPGDDLNRLANQYGTVHLSTGQYVLTQPLILNQPVTITADPGATLVFAQGASESPWTAAIKVHAGNTTLDGFAVRFTGPVRWNWSVSYDPAVIGTTDNLDPYIPGRLTNLTFTNLDLQGPPASSSTWEHAAGLIRLVTAESGRIENNTLQGGMITFQQGPWRITGNNDLGSLAGTYADSAFSGHDTHDVVISNNRVAPIAGSGKTWRFLVLTGSGYDSTISWNTIVGVGPRDDDTIGSMNEPEVILTESYRIAYEGVPLSVSPDGRIVQIPDPQGGAPSTGAGVAILAGPAAGQWRRVLQVIDSHTLLLDAPLPAGTTAISVANGFVNQTYEDNTIDSRGSSRAEDIVLVGNHFGLVVRDNTLIGGIRTLLVDAYASETPNVWGWTHSPCVGVEVSGNDFGPAVMPVWMGVEQSPYIKTNKNRTYFSAVVRDNVFAPATGSGMGMTLGNTGSIDPSESLVTLSGNRAKTGTVTISVSSATVNGISLDGAQLSLTAGSLPLPAPTGLRLVNDTGVSPTDLLTNDGHLQFNPVSGAANYEYQVGGSGGFQSLGTATAFLPSGLAQGGNLITVRAIDASGLPGATTSIVIVLDSVVPTTAALVLNAASDTGRSSSDGVTASTRPVFNVAAAATDLLALFRNNVLVAWGFGPGTIQDPGVPGDGTYTYMVVRSDPAGNFSVSATTTVTVDVSPPPAVAGLAVLAGSQIQIQPARAGDLYEYRVGTSGPYTPIGATTSFSLASLPRGRYTVAVHAVDLAGNVGPDKTVILDTSLAVTANWVGQDGHDYVGPGTATPDGIQDMRISLANLPAKLGVKSVTVTGYGGGIWDYNVASSHWRAAFVRPTGATTADLYIQPYQRETGRRFDVLITFDDGTVVDLSVLGGTAVPTLRMPVLSLRQRLAARKATLALGK